MASPNAIGAGRKRWIWRRVWAVGRGASVRQASQPRWMVLVLRLKAFVQGYCTDGVDKIPKEFLNTTLAVDNTSSFNQAKYIPGPRNTTVFSTPDTLNKYDGCCSPPRGLSTVPGRPISSAVAGVQRRSARGSAGMRRLISELGCPGPA